MEYLRFSDNISGVEPSAKYSIVWADVHGALGACASYEGEILHSAKSLPIRDTLIQVNDFLLIEDRVHILGWMFWLTRLTYSDIYM